MASPEIAPDELRARRRAGEDLILLDVREPHEVAEWAFPGSINIPLGELGARAGELPTDRPIIVACRSGARSASATEALNSAGWSAQNLAGGAIAWLSTEQQGDNPS